MGIFKINYEARVKVILECQIFILLIAINSKVIAHIDQIGPFRHTRMK